MSHLWSWIPDQMIVAMACVSTVHLQLVNLEQLTFYKGEVFHFLLPLINKIFYL